jgi:dipeptidyl aminopeptidase/acylaminoacyl peptidase
LIHALIFLAAITAQAAPTVVPVDPALDEIAATHRFLQTAISPDGAHVAYVEALPDPDQSAIYLAPRKRVTAGDGRAIYDEFSIAWSPDGKQLAFLSDREKKEQLQLYVAPADGGPAHQLTHLRGLVTEPRWIMLALATVLNPEEEEEPVPMPAITQEQADEHSSDGN